ncbi:hypothetical protein BLA60_27085 [Actinophytocola xinjiangensis]|uniref:Uncharacterized protein n=2 Tax=Actinophytocola xinjiangensis TaxID=485602 RepID=A0A7Z0WL65_9PSEU|nr:hypothetical protein BLA60_27085 [Actinophytocola xinjiangensis]
MPGMSLINWIVIGVLALLAGVMANWVPRPQWLRNIHLFIALGVLVAATAVMNFVFQSEPDENTTAIGTRELDEEPRPAIATDTYVLRVSRMVDTNDEDKIDLDTGCPGWGDMWPRVGPPRCGELGDVVVDEEGIHTGDDKPRLLLLGRESAGGHTSCLAGLTDESARRVGKLPLASLGVGSEICVKTDFENTGLVRIKDIATDQNGELRELTISYQVWTKR